MSKMQMCCSRKIHAAAAEARIGDFADVAATVTSANAQVEKHRTGHDETRPVLHYHIFTYFESQPTPRGVEP